MKKTKIAYWIVTAVFAVFIGLTAIPDVILSPDAVAFMTHLGYPNYFTVFIGVAKILGAIALLIPGFAKIKEWAYAGIFFDLIGATYSAIAVDGFNPGIFFMLIFFGLGIASYILNNKINSTN